MSVTTTPAMPGAGTVWQPHDAGYDAETGGFNTAFRHRPSIAVRPSTTAEAAAAVRGAVDAGLPVHVMATGHGMTGALQGGVALSMRGLTAVTVDHDAGTATIGGGARWRDVFAAASPHGWGGLCGSTSDVGVAGYTLGGGLPVLGRAFGFACDRLRQVELVTAGGEILRVGAGDPDLFWALRGAGHGLGVVTALTVDLLPLTQIAGGGLFFADEHAAAVLDAYAEWTTSLPDDLCTSLAFLRLPPLPQVPEPLRGHLTMHLRVTHPDASADLDALLAPMRACAPAVIDEVGVLPYAALDSIHRDPDSPAPALDRGGLLDALPSPARHALLAAVGPDADSPLLLVELRHLGGALRHERDSAIGACTAAFSLYAVGIADGSERVPDALNDLFTAMGPWLSPRTLVNLRGCSRGPAAASERSDAERTRLRDVKARVDPDGVFGVIPG